MRSLIRGQTRHLAVVLVVLAVIATSTLGVSASPVGPVLSPGATMQEATPEFELPTEPPEDPSRWLVEDPVVSEPEDPTEPAPPPPVEEVLPSPETTVVATEPVPVIPVEQPTEVVDQPLPPPEQESNGVEDVVEPTSTEEASPEAEQVEQAELSSASLAADEGLEAQDEPTDPTEYLTQVCYALDGDGDGYVTPEEVFFGVFFQVIPPPDVDPFLFVVLLAGGCNGLIQPRVTLELCLFLDQDRNGVVTEAEIQARIADGSLFPDSDAALIALVRAGGCEAFLEPVPPPVGDLTVELCLALDANGDLVVDEQEVMALAVDLNGDGVIDTTDYAMAMEGCAELLDDGSNDPVLTTELCLAIDTNGDGVVSSDEITAAVAGGVVTDAGLVGELELGGCDALIEPVEEPDPSPTPSPTPDPTVEPTPDPTEPADDPVDPSSTPVTGGTHDPQQPSAPVTGERLGAFQSGANLVTALPNTGTGGERDGALTAGALLVGAAMLAAIGLHVQRRPSRR